MSFVAVLRILARFKDARRADAAHRVSRRRPSFHETGEPGRSNGSDGRMVRQILEVTAAVFLPSLRRVMQPKQEWLIAECDDQQLRVILVRNVDRAIDSKRFD